MYADATSACLIMQRVPLREMVLSWLQMAWETLDESTVSLPETIAACNEALHRAAECIREAARLPAAAWGWPPPETSSDSQSIPADWHHPEHQQRLKDALDRLRLPDFIAQGKAENLTCTLNTTHDALHAFAIVDSMLCAHMCHSLLVWHFGAVYQMNTLRRIRCRRTGPQQGSGRSQRPHAVGRWRSQRRAGSMLSSSICLPPAPAHAGRPRNALRCNTAQQLAAKGEAWWL